ncbi:MAG: 5'-methylthioadenosine nucleosidase [Metamycoplasmataceae bacterium]
MINEVKNIGLIIADPEEINKINFPKIEEQEKFSIYKINDNTNMVVVNSGIGLVNAAAATQELIDKFNITFLLNYGAVGASGDKLNLFDVIIPQRIYCHDAITPWYPRGVIPGEKPFFSNFITKDKINLSSGNSFISDIKVIKDINEYYQANLFDMETYAYAAICNKQNIPFLTIKGISDIIEKTEKDIEKINENISFASEKALIELSKFIKEQFI